MITELKVLSENIYQIKTVHIIFHLTPVLLSGIHAHKLHQPVREGSFTRRNMIQNVVFLQYIHFYDQICSLWFVISLIVNSDPVWLEFSSFSHQLWSDVMWSAREPFERLKHVTSWTKQTDTWVIFKREKKIAEHKICSSSLKNMSISHINYFISSIEVRFVFRAWRRKMQ